MRIKNLTQHFRDAIQQEINETNDRITKFNEEQFRLLNLYRDKAEQEYNALVRWVGILSLKCCSIAEFFSFFIEL